MRCSVVRELFRLVRSETLTLDDFKSQGALGNRMRWNRNDPDAVRRWNDGVSVFDDFDHACEVAGRNGLRWIATIALESPSRFEVSHYGKDRYHYTIFGEPADLLVLVSDVRAVPRVPRE